MSVWDTTSWNPPERQEIDVVDWHFRRAVGRALQYWAEAHPAGDRPLVDLGDDESLTPRQLAAAFSNSDDPHHDVVIRIFEVGLSGYVGRPKELVEELTTALARETDEFYGKSSG